MVRQRAKSGRGGERPPAEGEGLSDEQILKERQRVKGFEVADGFLRLLSWGLWALAIAWFLLFSPSVASVAPGVEDLGRAAAVAAVAGEPVFVLFSCGQFCGGLAGAGPRGTWTWWRRGWHAAWVVVLLSGALAFLRFASMDRWARSELNVQLPPVSAAWALVGGLGASGGGMLLLMPRGGQANSPKYSGVLWGRLLLVADALFCGFVSLRALTAGLGRLSEPLGPAALWISVAPLATWALGLLLCGSDGELVAAAPAAILHWLMVSAWLLYTDTAASALLALALVLPHLALYLPLPLHEPDTNPFHVAFRRFWRRFKATLSSPIEGFGDCAEDG